MKDWSTKERTKEDDVPLLMTEFSRDWDVGGGESG